MYNNIPQQQGYNAPYYYPLLQQYQRQSSEIPTNVPLN